VVCVYLCLTLSEFAARKPYCSVANMQCIYASGWFLQSKRMVFRFLNGLTYSNFDSELMYISRYYWCFHTTRLFQCSSANADDHYTTTASEKLKSLKQKKETKRTERLERQRINELKKKVCICLL